MQESKKAIVIFSVIFCCAGLFYLFVMLANGSAAISSHNEDWGSFGSYLGGILAPAASLLAGYLVYKSLSSSMQQQKLIFARETIARLDNILEYQLDRNFNNYAYGDKYFGRPFREVVVSLSLGEMKVNEPTHSALVSLLHNIAIMANSIRYYIDLLEQLKTSKADSHWLGDLERTYWIAKYSPICSRMVSIVGEEALENKLSEDQLASFIFLLRGGKPL